MEKKQKKFFKQVNNYRLLDKIGEGASATVYVGIDDRKDEVVAVKTIAIEKLKENHVAESLQRELSILHKLKHNNIIKIKGYEKTAHNRYIILEYCNGGNLGDYKKFYEKTTNCTLNEFFIQKIIRQLADGLEYMHSNNIVHRDIKLDNILLNFNKYRNIPVNDELPPKVNLKDVTLNDSFTVKIADLGYSKDLEGRDSASTILGTPAYMSPDMIENYMGSGKPKPYNTSVDLWSLGAITYELLTKNPPFSGKDYKSLFKKVMEGKYTLPSHLKCSVEIMTFINGLLQYYPEKRLSWPQILNHPFLRKDVDEFTYIQLEALSKNDKNIIEMNSKDCDNLLWILFNAKNLNIQLDKINNEEIKKKEVKESINQNFVKNDEIKKAIENEKKKMEEEKKRLDIEKEEVKKLLTEAENLKKEAQKIHEQNKEEQKKLNDEDLKRKELEEKLKKEGELNQKKAEEIKKQINDYEQKIKEADSRKKENDLKLKEAEKKLKTAQNLQKNIENQIKDLNNKKLDDEKKQNEDLEKMKEKEKILLSEKEKRENEIKNLKEQKEIKEQEFNKEKEKLLKQISEIKDAKKNLEKETNKNKEIEEKLKNKEKIIEELNEKLNKITQEKNEEIIKIENQKIGLEKIENEIKNNNEDESENLKIENKNDDENDFDAKDWVFYNGEEVDSVVGDENYQEDILKEFEIVDHYVEDDKGEVDVSDKIEI